jgi:hypothetical protein
VSGQEIYSDRRFRRKASRMRFETGRHLVASAVVWRGSRGLRSAPAPSALNRCDHLNSLVHHVTTAMNSHVTSHPHILSQGGRYRRITKLLPGREF